MRNTGPIIDGQKQPEGYITDYQLSIIPATAGQKPQDIFAEIYNLPVTATVIFELENINMAASANPSFEINVGTGIKHDIGKVIHSVNSSTTENQTQTVRFTGNKTLTATYRSKIPSYIKEYVRLKYKGGSGAHRTLTLTQQQHKTKQRL